jgi:hypothetical protein
MNVAEGERALAEARRALANGNIQKGLKFLKISQRLSPSQEAMTLIEQYSLAQTPSSPPPPSSPSHNSSSQPSTNTRDENSSRLTQDIIEAGHRIWRSVSEMFLQFETKYIAPSMRQFIRALFLAVLCLSIIKYVFKQKIGFGALPGDLSYSSPNLSISAPFVSSFLVSFLFTGLVRAFQP